jgi:D-amino-acid dehydrogenase
MRRHGVDRQVLDRAGVLAIEPSLAAHGPHIHGGTYTRSDESGDARVFTQELARRAVDRGLQALWQHEVLGLEQGPGGAVNGVQVRDTVTAERRTLRADAVVVAMGAYSAPLLRPLGIHLNIYPAKGYSATYKLRDPARASVVSLLDDSRKIAISRLGDRLRVAGTAELAGFDTRLDSPTARKRCEALTRRVEELFPGVVDTSEPSYWTGLRPSTPDNIPLIGRTRLPGLWVNAGHGTLGWTHGAGSGLALAELMSGRQPELAFRFTGFSSANPGGRMAMA